MNGASKWLLGGMAMVQADIDTVLNAPVIKQPTLDDVVSVLKERDSAFATALDAKVSAGEVKEIMK